MASAQKTIRVSTDKTDLVKAKLRQDRSLDDEARRVLTMQAMQDSQRQRELQKSIGGVADPFRLIGLETAGADQA